MGLFDPDDEDFSAPSPKPELTPDKKRELRDLLLKRIAQQKIHVRNALSGNYLDGYFAAMDDMARMVRMEFDPHG